jgi:hypothetical protein
MATTSERVDRLEQVFASFMERTEEMMADIRANVAEMRASNARTDAVLLEMQQQADKDRQQAEKERKDFNKRLAELSQSMGTLIEDMVAPNARRIAEEIFPGDPVVMMGQRLRRVHPDDRGRMMEVDLLVAGRNHVMVVEAKRRIDPEKIRDFLERMSHLPEFFPEYSQHKLVPVMATVNVDPTVITYLNRQKVYGVAMGDETMELVNLGQF